MDYNFIVIEGNIGAGKTSLSNKIANQFNAKLILEQFAEIRVSNFRFAVLPNHSSGPHE